MKNFKTTVSTLLILTILFFACKKAENEATMSNLDFEKAVWQVNENEEIELKIKENKTNYYDLDLNSLGLAWSVSDPQIIAVSQKGIVTAKKAGFAKVTAKSTDEKYSLSTEIVVYNSVLTNKINQPLNQDLIYSKGVYLVRNSVMQCFDVDSKGTIYYDQVGGNLAHVLFVVKGEANQAYSSSMQLKYFGHGTNMAIEEEGDDRYIWIGSNGHKASDGQYGSNKTFTRVKYVADGIAERSNPDDTYYYPGKANIHPAIDQENDILAVTTSGGGDPLRYFYIYKLSAVKALTPTLMELPSLKFGGEESGVPEQTVVQQENVKDISKLTPIARFSVGPSTNKNNINSYAFQGFDISDGKLYFYEGEGNGNRIASGVSNAFVTVFDYTKGKEISKRASVSAIANLIDLNTYGVTATGYMEAEGIKMKNGNLYLGFASKSTDNRRLANILIYKK